MDAYGPVRQFLRNTGVHSCGLIPEAKQAANRNSFHIDGNVPVELHLLRCRSGGKTTYRSEYRPNEGPQPSLHRFLPHSSCFYCTSQPLVERVNVVAGFSPRLLKWGHHPIENLLEVSGPSFYCDQAGVGLEDGV